MEGLDPPDWVATVGWGGWVKGRENAIAET